MLDMDEFALAMHLMNIKLDGKIYINNRGSTYKVA